MVLYHGSQNLIEKPFFGGGRTANDYGQGFYCTESESLACEWAVSDKPRLRRAPRLLRHAQDAISA